MNICVVPLLLLLQVTNCFKLPDLDVTLDTDIHNAHDQFQDSIINSTITSINLSVVHVASEVVLLVLIICSHKKLSDLIHKISLHILRNNKPGVSAVSSV